MWYRVFGAAATDVPPSMLATHLHAVGLPVVPHFKGDDLGWTSGQLVLPGGGSPVGIDHYLTDEDDLRDSLNAFAAELETMDYSPNNTRLMTHVISTKHLFALRRPLDHADEITLDKLCQEVVRFLAARTDGIYQIDGQGWFAADGTLLVQEH
ncbi:hypothetical protein [Fimbriiglobus ruber]|uniref:Uncharacterized protein n=1 Tax=Fimbriiglobus ruber TaxID=1908690 RepID=A0A225DHB7_9BACT|nr:hypothetical protein [Fimbriiglobus ruber]OWK37948.1 hypothetical protein FRUB_07068 [Fimbriiglobus ruber]